MPRRFAAGIGTGRAEKFNLMIKIIIADDHPIIRGGLKQMVSMESDMEFVGEAKNATELLTLLGRQPCDVVVLDISMPGKSGLDVLKEVKSIQPHLAVLILTMYSENQYALRALKDGAAGYMTKDSAPEHLAKVIRQISAGGKYISPAVAAKLVDYLGTGTDKPLHEELSDREYEVLRKIAAGRTVRQIAEELFLSPNTVSTYRSRLLVKMKLSSTAALIRYAIANHLVD